MGFLLESPVRIVRFSAHHLSTTMGAVQILVNCSEPFDTSEAALRRTSAHHRQDRPLCRPAPTPFHLPSCLPATTPTASASATTGPSSRRLATRCSFSSSSNEKAAIEISDLPSHGSGTAVAFTIFRICPRSIIMNSRFCSKIDFLVHVLALPEVNTFGDTQDHALARVPPR